MFRLYRLTGNSSFTEILGTRVEIKGRGLTSAPNKPIDSEGYYATIGLNPYALRFLDEEIFEAIVKEIKRGLAKKLHSDTAKPRQSEADYFKRMLAACAILENSDSRKQYSTWLND